MNHRVLIAAMAALWLLSPFNTEAQSANGLHQEIPYVYGINLTSEDRYAGARINKEAVDVAGALFPDSQLKGYAVARQPLPGGNHVWMAGASEQSNCTGVAQSLQNLEAELEKAIRLTDELDTDGATASMETLFGVLPCLGEYADPELLWRAHVTVGVVKYYISGNAEDAALHFRDSLTGGVDRSWDDSYPPDLKAIYNRVYSDVSLWGEKNDSPFWVSVELQISGAQDVRIDGKEGITQVLPGTHLIQWRDDKGLFQGRTFVVRPEAGTRLFGDEIKEYAKREGEMVSALDASAFQKTLTNPDLTNARDRVVLREYFKTLTDGNKGILIGVSDSGVLGTIWTRNGGQDEFSEFETETIEKLIPKTEGTTTKSTRKGPPVYGGFSLELGARWHGDGSYGELRLGGHLNPGPGVWIDVVAGFGLTQWIQEDPLGNITRTPYFLAEVGVGARYVFQTPSVGTGKAHLRPFVGGRATMLNASKQSTGGGGVFVGGLEVHPKGDAPLWIRLGGFVGAVGGNGAVYPTYGVNIGLAFHNEHRRQAD